MQISTLALLGAFFTASLAAPSSASGPALAKRDPPRGVCGDSLFVDRTSDASPNVNDCLAIIDDIYGSDRGTIFNQLSLPNTDEDPVRSLVHGSCVMGFRKAYQGGQTQYTTVGAQDAIDLINDSVRRFASNGKVGAEGAMVCQDGIPANAGVWWGLFHS